MNQISTLAFDKIWANKTAKYIDIAFVAEEIAGESFSNLLFGKDFPNKKIDETWLHKLPQEIMEDLFNLQIREASMAKKDHDFIKTQSRIVLTKLHKVKEAYREIIQSQKENKNIDKCSFLYSLLEQ